MSALDVFSSATRAWFEGTFEEPTPAQTLGWPAIARGGHTLIQAPTGSGKTLAAFLYGIDKLTAQRSAQSVRVSGPAEGARGNREVPPASDAGVRLLYVSPLKALNGDAAQPARHPHHHA